MLDLTNPDSDASENGNSKYADSSDGQGVGTSRKPEIDKFSLEERRKDLADLAIWLSGLNGTKLALDDPHSLCNGRAFAELLHVIDDSFFDERWLETMPGMRTTSNLVVKRSNIRKLWRKISDYYSMLGRNIGQRWYEIGERVDNIEETDIPVAVDLAMAVVAIALIGTKKEKWISYSKEFAETYRNEMTNVARMVEIVVKEMPELSDNVTFHEISDLHDSQNELNCSQPESSVVSNKNGFGERRRSSSNNDQVLVEAQLEIDSLRGEKDSLLKEVERLTKALDNSQLDDSISSAVTILEKQNEELRIKRRQMEEKTLELEAALEHFQSTVKKLTEENDTLQSSQKEFNMLRSHLDCAQSDVEEWRAKANQYQTDAELGKKREKEVKELQGQVSSLTSRLAHLIKTATEDEDNKAGIMQLRSQLGTITANNVELNVALESKQRIVEQLEIQLIQYKEKVKELEDRKEDLIAERNELENQLHFKDQVTPRSLHESMFEAGNLSFDEKSKLPLEIENKRLAERIQELEALEPLKGEIITMRSQNGLLEEQKLVIKKQMEELERQVAELQEKLAMNQKHASGDSVELRIQLEKANVEVERMKEAEMRAETKLADVKELLQKRNAEYETNEKALERAKSVIDEMEDRCRPVGEDSITSVQAFKEMKEENERLRQKVEKYEIDLNTITQSYEQENRLITSAAYQQVLDRSSDAVMSMRAQGGTDAPRTMLDAQKANSALPWRLISSTEVSNSLQ